MQSIISSLQGQKKLPHVESWNPPDCGDIDMEIKRDGTWLYMGTPIGRVALVRLFASVLTRDGARYVLKTPVEKVGIRVEDAPFLAVEMREEAGVLWFRTLQDDWVSATPDNPLRFVGQKPYIHVRRGCDALINRAVFYDLMERGIVCDGVFGVESGGGFYGVCDEGEL
jgi:uncharacterized protein